MNKNRFHYANLPGLLFNTDGDTGGGGAPVVAPVVPTAPVVAPAALTQGDVDRIVTDRVAREKAKYVGFDDFKAKATKFDEGEAAKAPELERTRLAAIKEGGDAARAELTHERVLDKIEVAAAGKFSHPEDVQEKLSKRIAEFIGKDGTIDAAAITAAVDKLLTDRPDLAAETSTTVPSPGWVGIGAGGSSTGDEGVQPGLGRLQHAYAQSPHAQK